MGFVLPILLLSQQPSVTLCGTWQFYAYIYQGQQIAAPNASLYEVLEFQSNQVVRLYYKHDDEDGFCERKAHYQFDNETFQQKIFWVNPGNQSSCSQDPDMQDQRETVNKAVLKDNVFYLDMPLGDGTITYLWKQTEAGKCQEISRQP